MSLCYIEQEQDLYVYLLQVAETVEDVCRQRRHRISSEIKGAVRRRREALLDSHSSLLQPFNADHSSYSYMN